MEKVNNNFTKNSSKQQFEDTAIENESHDEETFELADSELDKVLVERIQNGDTKAFDLLVLKYQQKIAMAIYSYIKDIDEVQDVVQEIFIKAFRYLPDFRGDSAFYSWLYRIAINTSKNYLAAKKIRPPKQDIDYTEAHSSDTNGQLIDIEQPDKSLQNSQAMTELQFHIDKLPDELKNIIIYREIDGMDYKEIAEKMNVPVGTVRSRLFRARKMLIDEAKHLL